MSINNFLRQQLITLCRRGRDRTADFSTNRPTDWRPFSVRNPHGAIDTHFTHVSAWEFIAVQLEANCDVEIIKLENPQGAKGYVINARVSPATNLQSTESSSFKETRSSDAASTTQNSTKDIQKWTRNNL